MGVRIVNQKKNQTHISPPPSHSAFPRVESIFAVYWIISNDLRPTCNHIPTGTCKINPSKDQLVKEGQHESLAW